MSEILFDKAINKFVQNQIPIKAYANNESKSSHQRCSIKKLFLKALKYSQENICVEVSF